MKIMNFKLLPLQAGALALILTLVPVESKAQKNYITNGDFENSSVASDLWDGVDRHGYLAGWTGSIRAVAERGFGNIAMPVVPRMVDLNNNGLKDLMTVDGRGYFRIYWNEGTAEEPKFTTGDILPLYLGTHAHDEIGRTDAIRAIRMDVAPIGPGGRLDLILGDYVGRILRIPNAGSSMRPDFAQPRVVADTEIPTAPDYWGNLFAPLAYDWTGNGAFDLLVGEGSYSANAIHLLVNQGSSERPVFSTSHRYFLAYGDGREHLLPTIVDYNNNGFPDLLVSDRTGRIGVYLHPERKWEPGDELVFSHYVKIGDQENFGGLTAPLAVDVNGNGLFDLVVGRHNGRIGLALNTGELGEPKFEEIQDLQGEDVWEIVRDPAGWVTNFMERRGNVRAYITTVTAEEDPQADPRSGESVLKAGYRPSINKIVSSSLLRLIDNRLTGGRLFYYHPGETLHGPENRTYRQYPHTTTPSDTFSIRQALEEPLKVGKEYQVSFQVKGRDVREAQCNLGYVGQVELAPSRITRGTRGAARVDRSLETDEQTESFNFAVGGQWSTVSRNFRVNLRGRELRDLEEVNLSVLEIIARLPNQDSVLYIDDVKLVER